MICKKRVRIEHGSNAPAARPCLPEMHAELKLEGIAQVGSATCHHARAQRGLEVIGPEHNGVSQAMLTDRLREWHEVYVVS